MCDYVTFQDEWREGDAIYQEKVTGIYFKLKVVKGYGDFSGGVDTKYNFPYTAEDIASNVVERHEKEVVTIETYFK